jgi:hypothetical protein
MSSFINMMASDRWSEADIVNRTEAMIAAEFPPAQVAILNRIATAAALGQYQLTEQEAADIERYNLVCLAAREAGDAARADMVLLAQTLDYEAAKATIARCGPEVVALYALRNPAPVAENEETA